jgi:hypothetical protein
MKKILSALIIISSIFIFYQNLISEPQNRYKGKGEALIVNTDLPAAKMKALNEAFKNAVQKAVGVYIKSQSKVENFELTYNKIIGESEGYISNYKITGEKKEDNIYYVEIEADVYSEKIINSFSERISKYIEKNLFGPAGMMHIMISRMNTFNLIHFIFWFPINDPTIEKDYIELKFPVAGWFKPNIMEAGLGKSIYETEKYDTEEIKNTDFSKNSIRFYKDILIFLKDPNSKVIVKFKNPSNNKIEERSVSFGQASIYIYDNLKEAKPGKPFINVPLKKISEISKSDIESTIDYFENLNGKVIQSKKTGK